MFLKEKVKYTEGTNDKIDKLSDNDFIQLINN